MNDLENNPTLAERLDYLRDNPGVDLHIDERHSTEMLRVPLTDEEMLQMGRDLAAKQQDLKQLEDDKKSIAAEFAAKITGIEGQISITANKLRQGYENRSVRCLTVFDQPTSGKKTTYRLDTMEAIETRAMLDEEKQRVMQFMQEQADARQVKEEAKALITLAKADYPNEEKLKTHFAALVKLWPSQYQDTATGYHLFVADIKQCVESEQPTAVEAVPGIIELPAEAVPEPESEAPAEQSEKEPQTKRGKGKLPQL